jgi:large subunit ribosomal protein L22
MEVKVKCSNIGVSAHKVRKVANLIRGKKASHASRLLRFGEKKEISLILFKLLNSGLTIAANEKNLDVDNLIISTLFVDEGRTLKRVQPRAQGRAFRIRKRTSSISLGLKEK